MVFNVNWFSKQSLVIDDYNERLIPVVIVKMVSILTIILANLITSFGHHETYFCYNFIIILLTANEIIITIIFIIKKKQL